MLNSLCLTVGQGNRNFEITMTEVRYSQKIIEVFQNKFLKNKSFCKKENGGLNDAEIWN